MYGQGARCAQIHHVNDCVDPLVNNNNNNIYIYLKSNIHSITRYKFSGPQWF